MRKIKSAMGTVLLGASVIAGGLTTKFNDTLMPPLYAMEQQAGDFVLQDPPLGPVERWTISPSELYRKKVQALVDRLNAVQQGDSRADQVANALKIYEDDRIKNAAARALQRIGTQSSRNALYSLIISGGNSENDKRTAGIAANELSKVDPHEAALGLIKRKGNSKDGRSHFGVLSGNMGAEVYDDLTNALISTGDGAALDYFINNRMADETVSFVNRNDSQLLQTYKSKILDTIDGKLYPADRLACHNENALINYGRAIRKLDRSYAEGAAASRFEDFSNVCASEWRGTNAKRIFLGALRGEY